jgi:hypothetical protein
MQHEKARCRKRGRSGTCPHKHEVKGVRIAPGMDVVLSKFTYPIELAHLCTVLA